MSINTNKHSLIYSYSEDLFLSLKKITAKS